jgi:hypothetical protein
MVHAVTKTYGGGFSAGFFKLKYQSSGLEILPIKNPITNGSIIINESIN